MDLSGARWRKSTRSETASCVEVADNLPDRVLVRDTKNREGGQLTFTTNAWSAFIRAVRA
jgi:hypothetical protein